MDEKRASKARCGRTGGTRNATPKVPPLPKLHSRGPLVTTKLSQPIFKSTVGHDFDLSRPVEDEPFREYNTLHDPHTRALFHRPSVSRKLQRNGFVTEEMQVVCSLREYNAYREFMECESMKMTRKKLDENSEKEKAHEKTVVKEKAVDPVQKEREERRKKFFREQERKAASKQRQVRRVQQREERERLKVAEEKKLMRERNEIRREAEREQRRLSKLQQKHQEAVEKRRQLHNSENQMLVRMLQLQHTRQSHRLQQIKELESKWQAYDDHVQKARDAEEREKVRAKEEKERKRIRREKIVQLMKAKKEARMRELHEQTCQQVEELRRQADEREKLWREKKEQEVVAWRERIHREQEHWEHHIHHQMEASHNQHQQEMDHILHTSYLPSCAKTTMTTGAAPKWIGGGSTSDVTTATMATSSLRRQSQVHHGHRKSRDGLLRGERKKSVRFQQEASIHIIDEDELGLESDVAITTTADEEGREEMRDTGVIESESRERSGEVEKPGREEDGDSSAGQDNLSEESTAAGDGEQEREGEKKEGETEVAGEGEGEAELNDDAPVDEQLTE